MILLMDRKASVEATELREWILKRGLPCAASFSPFDTALLAHTHCVLTTREGYATVRAYMASDRYANLPVFMMSETMPGKVYRTDGSPEGKSVGRTLPLVDALIPYIKPDVCKRRGNPSLYLMNGFIISPAQIFFRSTPLTLTERERRIMQFFLLHPEMPHPCRRVAISSLAKPMPESTVKEVDSIAHAISIINRKTANVVGERVLHRLKGAIERSYYFEMS